MEEQCPHYETNAKENYLFGQIQTFCNISKCPYSKQIKPTFGGENLPKICKSKGLVEKLK